MYWTVLAFNIPGVKEHAYFLKDVRDARAIRLRILECKSVRHFSFDPQNLTGFVQASNKPASL